MTTSFDEAWAAAEQATGWLTRAQGGMLWDAARELSAGSTALEIGSFQGRSTILLARALGASDGRVVAVDPFVEDWKFGSPHTRDLFTDNLRTSGVTDRVELVAQYSTKARPGWQRPLDLLYIDGKHDYWTFTDDLLWAVHLPEAAPVLVHDCYSSVGVTLGVLAKVLPSRSLRYERRVDSMALFRVGRPTAADRLRILGELPWWVRNVAVKVLLRARLRPLAQLLGHDSPYDPY